jgi:hypothetical protein
LQLGGVIISHLQHTAKAGGKEDDVDGISVACNEQTEAFEAIPLCVNLIKTSEAMRRFMRLRDYLQTQGRKLLTSACSV